MALTQIQQDGLSANALSAITASVLAPGAVAGNVYQRNGQYIIYKFEQTGTITFT